MPPPKKPTPKPEPQFEFMLTSISPGSLGLKTVYWTKKEGDPIRFEPIVGWVVTHSRQVTPTQTPFAYQFQPVMIFGEFPQPAIVGFNDYLGTTKESTTEADVKRIVGEGEERNRRAVEEAKEKGEPAKVIPIFGAPTPGPDDLKN